METYDYIIAGGGCAGLSLAYHLTAGNADRHSILIIDREVKRSNDRTWCFWNDGQGDFQQLIHRQWPRLAFADNRGELEPDLGALQYQMLRSADFYRFMHQQLQPLPNVHFKYGYISHLFEDDDGPCAVVDGQRFRSKWIFNSCFRLPRMKAQAEGKRFLLQHFKGWQINSPIPVFDPERAMLMDFRVEQKGVARFFYVLPLSERRALVEFTAFSAHTFTDSEYDEALRQYIGQQLGIPHFEIEETEQGAIPMTDMKMPPRQSPHIINIGTAGGAVKPTTGYTFQRIQQQTKEIARLLQNGQDPVWAPTGKARFRFYDTLLLHILEQAGHQAAPIFSALFRHNTMERVLTFLDERSSWWQEASIFLFLPKIPFLRALLETQLLSELSVNTRRLPGQQSA